MKIEFYDPFNNENLKYQKDAIESITDIFKGQEATNTLFGIKGRNWAVRNRDRKQTYFKWRWTFKKYSRDSKEKSPWNYKFNW